MLLSYTQLPEEAKAYLILVGELHYNSFDLWYYLYKHKIMKLPHPRRYAAMIVNSISRFAAICSPEVAQTNHWLNYKIEVQYWMQVLNAFGFLNEDVKKQLIKQGVKQ